MKQALWMVMGVLLAASLACSTKFKGDEDGDGDGGDERDTQTDEGDGDGQEPDADVPAETDGTCGPGSCTIGGGCYGNGEHHPENFCQVCDPAVDDGDWTLLPGGTPCPDELFCNDEEQCSDTGECVSSGNPCPENADCVEAEPHCRCRPGWHGDGCTLCHRYVAPGGAGPDGTSWERAFGDIQAALDDALAGGCDEVWAREGEYRPALTIQMKGAIALYGGFAGDETAREMRDWRAHETILDGQGSLGPIVRFDGTSCSDGARIDGFTLAGGNNTGSPSSGGAVYVNQVSPTIAACTFRQNSGGGGGALYLNASDARVLDCKFVGNHAESNGGAVAMYGVVDDPVTPHFENCLFWDNDADNFGGAVYLDRWSRPSLMTCTIVDNRANTGDNTSSLGKWGGGICIYESDVSAVSVVNTIVFSNVHLDPVTDTFVPSQIQCLFVTTPPCEPAITAVHADIEGGCAACTDGGGNISGNPQFLDPGADDYHLGAGSPCIDRGLDTDAPAFDLDGVARHDTPSVGDVGVVTDIGCYELP